ncbi:MAG: aminotransferase class IV [Pseudobdellovibrionaceae bacterium]
MNIPILDSEAVMQKLKAQKNPFWTQYHAFFSTWLGGITLDPALMIVPMDDHMVHRGDAVFEALKAVDAKVFLLEPHLKRLEISASRIGITLPFSLSQIEDLIFQTLKVAKQPQALIRLFVSRGPGGFTTNPYDSVASQMYVAITDLRTPKAEAYLQGVKIGKSRIPVKESWMAQVKSCNYLPNVMMKKEAVDRGLDFTIGFDAKNFVAESSTENIAIVDEKGILVHPHFDNILRGTTMVRVFELAKAAGYSVEQRNFSEADLLKAQEVFMIGTTLDVLPVVQFEEQKISGGVVGPKAKELLALLKKDFALGKAF